MVASPKDSDVKQRLLEEIETLPAEALAEVASFVEYQWYKLGEQPEGKTRATPYRPLRLEGFWAGVRIDEEDIREARRDMWAGVGDDDV